LILIAAFLLLCIDQVARFAYAFFVDTVRVVELSAFGILSTDNLVAIDFIRGLGVSHFASTLGTYAKRVAATLFIGIAAVTNFQPTYAFLSCKVHCLIRFAFAFSSVVALSISKLGTVRFFDASFLVAVHSIATGHVSHLTLANAAAAHGVVTAIV